MTITKVEQKKVENTIYTYNYHFTIENKEEEIIIPQDIITSLIEDYLRNHTNLGR